MYHKNANKKQKMCPLCQKMCPLCPLVGPTMPVAWASTARRMGIHRTSAGQQVPVVRATSAQKTESILGNTDKSFTVYNCSFLPRHFLPRTMAKRVISMRSR